MAEKALGKSKMAFVVVFLFFVNLLGASISYLIVIHWALSTTVGYLSVNHDISIPEYMSWINSGERFGLLGPPNKYHHFAVHLLPTAQKLQFSQPDRYHNGSSGRHHYLLVAAHSANWRGARPFANGSQPGDIISHSGTLEACPWSCSDLCPA